MGGTKRKIEIKKIENKPAISVTFTKRRDGLFSKASELCLLSPASQIAILMTPAASKSHASFYSFGHSSVDHVVSSLLHDQFPLPATNQDNRQGLGFWWEDEVFERLENVDELKDATDAVARMLNNLRHRLDAVMSNQRDGGLVIHQEEVLQLENTETNKNEENQITIFEGASGSGSLVEKEEDNLHIDDFFTDLEIDQLF